MFQIQCDICNINYQNALDFVLQNQIPKSDAALRPFLESISHCTKDIVQVFTTSVSEKDIQNVVIYIINTYYDKLKKVIEKTFLKNGFTINITSLSISNSKNTQGYFINIIFDIISCSNKALKPFLSEKLIKNLLHIKALTNALQPIAENILKKQCNFIEVKNLNIAVI